MREPVQFQQFYSDAVSICEDVGVTVPSVKRRKVSRRLDEEAWNTQHHIETKEEEFRITSFYPLLDSFVVGIDERFQQETVNVVTAMGKLLSLDVSCEDVVCLANQFKGPITQLAAEIKLLKADNSITSLRKKKITQGLWRQVHCPQGTRKTKQERAAEKPSNRGKGQSSRNSRQIKEWLEWFVESGRKEIYMCFFQVLTLFTVIPVTSCSCERAFSKLSQVKTKLRSTMKQQRLDSLLLVYMEQELASSECWRSY